MALRRILLARHENRVITSTWDQLLVFESFASTKSCNIWGNEDGVMSWAFCIDTSWWQLPIFSWLGRVEIGLFHALFPQASRWTKFVSEVHSIYIIYITIEITFWWAVFFVASDLLWDVFRGCGRRFWTNPSFLALWIKAVKLDRLTDW